MPRNFYIYNLPKFVPQEELAGGTVVVIDVLRASTTIIFALQAGAKAVIPCREIDEAHLIVRQFPRGEAILGGERGGLPIEGFDLGNSPEEYTPERVRGKTIVFTTTNGTRAMLHARCAKNIFIGTFLNASAVAKRLVWRETVHLLCAGTENLASDDDVLFAGLLIEKLQRQGGAVCVLNDQAIAARDLWLHTLSIMQLSEGDLPRPEQLAERLQKTIGGKNLVSLDMQRDILASAQIDRFAIVPRFDPETSVITIPRSPTYLR